MGLAVKALIIAVVGGGLFYLLVKVLVALWPRSGRTGINLDKVKCPECYELMPGVRKPRNIRQILWGGWTCKKCGIELDKYGNEVSK